MKQKVVIICAVLISLSLAGCSTKHTGTAAGGSGIAQQGILAYYNFSAVRAERPDKTPRYIIITVIAGYYESKSLAEEIAAKDVFLKTVIAEFAAGIDAGHQSDFSRYNEAHDQLKDMLNAKLKRGKIEKILFKKIEMQ